MKHRERKKEFKKCKRITELWDNIKKLHMHITVILERKKTEGYQKNI